MRKKYLSRILLGGLIIASTVTLNSCKDYDDDIDGLQEQIDSLSSSTDSDVSTIQSSISTLQSTASSLSSEIDDVQSDLADAQDELEAAIAAKASSDDVEALEDRIDALEIEVASLQSSLASVESAISALQTALEEYATKEELVEQVAILEAAIAEANAYTAVAQSAAETAQAAADAAQDTADANSEAIAQLAEQLATVQSDLEAQMTALSETILATVAETYATKAELEGEIATVNYLITDLTSRVETLASSTDIEDLQAQIDELEARIEILEGYKEILDSLDATIDGAVEAAEIYTDLAVAALQEYIDSNYTTTEGLSDLVNDVETLQSVLSEFQDEYASKIEEIEGSLETINNAIATINSSIESIKEAISEMSSTIAGISTDIEGISSTIEGINTTIEGILASIDEINNVTIANIVTSIETINTSLDTAVTDINTSIIEMYDILSTQLKSLVFSPELYWGGIEAIEVPYYTYDEIKLDAVTAEDDCSSDEPMYIGAPESEISVAPLITASYYLNPSNAAIETDASYYSYIVNHAKTVSRSLDKDDIEIKSVKRTSGVIDVTFKILDAGLVSLLANGDSEIDVAALQYINTDDEENEINITSDFAALYIDEINELYINAVSTEGAVDSELPTTYDNHLAATAADAISDYESNGADLTVKYYESIDLDEWINVHKGNSTSGTDELLGGQTTLAESDFYMTYELVGWMHGTYQTSESVHASLSNGVLTPTPIDGAAAVTTVGRAPMVRVTLWDNNDSANAHIAAVGYIIIEITEDEPETTVVSTSVTLENEYVIICGSDDETYSTTWDEIEVQIYSLPEVNLSKANFEKYYSLEEGTNGAVQYDENYEVLDAADYIGTVTLTTVDSGSTQTNVLQWAISNTESYAAFVTSGKSELVTYVKLVSSDSSYPDIYVQLTWAPSNAPISGLTATIANSSKIAADWHANNSRSSGYYDIHFEVGNPTDPSATDDYDPLVVNNTFKTGYTPYETIYTTVDNYSSTLAASLSDEVYTFDVTQDVTSYKTTQGNTYYTYVYSDTSIGVTTVKNDPSDYVELATLDQTDGTVTLVDSDILREILNSPEYGDYATSLTFTIGLVASTCDPAGSDFITAKFASGDIDVIVVKPLYITAATVKGMQWNDYSSLTQDLVITLHDYNGYDDETFFEKSEGGSTIVDFYGITGIDVDYANITDNYDGSEGCYYSGVNTTNGKYDIVANVNISTDATTGAVTFGTVTLTQATSSRGNDFEIYLPVILTYDWGEIYATVTVYVEAASGD